MTDVCEFCAKEAWLTKRGGGGEQEQQDARCRSHERQRYEERIRALEAELTTVHSTIADLSYQLGKAQGEAEGLAMQFGSLRAELQAKDAELAEVRAERKRHSPKFSVGQFVSLNERSNDRVVSAKALVLMIRDHGDHHFSYQLEGQPGYYSETFLEELQQPRAERRDGAGER